MPNPRFIAALELYLYLAWYFFSDCEWRWDSNVYPSTSLKHEGREVLFHPDYSCGTAAARGENILQNGGEHFWEVKMTSAVYGTDMVGFPTLDPF